ncbi:protein argonaute-2-like isoform X2 [Aphis gossypii]|uniref:protein argonaute-2-like isoform X2 n=1 Tax=Aphis gossypii TaxID=80765 RepID=UPI00215960D8|nr:protein argonaute-2-like isoform X2 [Aphis gossypii]
MPIMNPNKPNNQFSGVPGKKKQKKGLEQRNSNINVEHSQGPLNSGPKDFQQLLQNKPNAKQESVQKQTKPKEAKQHQTQKKNQLEEQNDLPQTSQSKPNTKQQTAQKQNKPKEANQKQNKKGNKFAEIKSTQKQSGGKNLSTMPQSSPTQGNQQIEQQIRMFKSQLLIPKRRNPQTGGSMGRVTEIEVNHLPLNLDKLFNKTVYHIDVQFEPAHPKTLFRIALEEFNNKHYPKIHFAFDGSRNMYTTKEIKGRTDLITVLNDENKGAAEFTIITSVVNIIPMNKIQEYLKSGSSNNPPGEAFQALDIILKNRPFSLRFSNIGRTFFPLSHSTPVDLGEGLELWNGFFQSPVMGWKPYLNIDVVHKGFPKHQPLISYITNDLRCDPKTEMDSQNINTLLNYVKGLKVEFMVPMQPNTKRLHKVVGIFDSASKFTFNMKDPVKGNQMVNVVQYFKIVRNYIIKYPNLPCLHVGNVNKKTAIPIELCTLQMGQIRLKKLTDTQIGIMIKNTARPPTERRQAIANSLRDIKYSQDPVLKEFGVDIKEQFVSVPARVLDQPSLAYAHNTEIKPKAGIWKVDKFSKPVHIKNWVVLNLDYQINIISIRNFEKMLITTGKDLNVTINSMNPVINCFLPRNFNLDEFKATIESIFTKLKACNTEIIFVVIPEIQTGVYGIIKQKSELEVGVLTQCIKSNTISNMNIPTYSNLLLKINSKLNGTNHTLSNKSSPPCMVGAIIFGADVTHPTLEQTSTPSVAAVAASHDISGIQYNMEWRLQAPRVEIIQDLENIIHLQLIKFKDKTKTVPKKIFYFRDGVSESQFLQLLEYELIAIRRACLRLHIKYKPPVTFLVVQKRHHTRMFPKFTHDMDGNFGNVISGTVVDTQITHPTELDFYLCSHSSIQGTSRPTKYHRIWDENYLTEDQLEQLTFYLCFMFARCTRAIAYPAPTYYAHLAAFRARAYLENKTINLNRLDDEQSKNKLNHLFTVNTPMFFV